MAAVAGGYALIDSGDGEKLEQFGEYVIARPSSLCAWKKRASNDVWKRAAATLTPDGGWHFSGRSFNTWDVSISGIKLELHLQPNGQIGIFPEHASYLAQLEQDLTLIGKDLSRPIEVLNLFAYTGLASLFCTQARSEFSTRVTHVDLAKRAIEWAKKNVQLNKLRDDGVRFIVDDALAFMAREARIDKKYDAIIIDPPSFSRISKNNVWTLEEKLPEIIGLCLSVLSDKCGVIYLSNHSSVNTVDVARNILLDHFHDRGVSIETRSLGIKEASTERVLPAGSLVRLCHGF